MKKKVSILLTTLFFGMCTTLSYAKCKYEGNGLLVGQTAPSFATQAVVDGQIVDHFSLEEFKGKYVVLLFYPLDFTFVCPTELHAFQEKEDEFAARNAQVVACSVDSAFSHFAWLNTRRELGGIQGVAYPLVSDFNKSIARDFHVLSEDEGIAYRALFVIGPDGIVRHLLINDLPIGRSVDEVLRTLDALISYEKLGEVCPANWMPGDKTFAPTAEGLIDYLK
ncbi:MAG: peroxiredoxin [Rhabdochlamydiaceae bacterium]|jgi:peroxiredoxin (alkyl hydroperoxide reductase subunit C)